MGDFRFKKVQNSVWKVEECSEFERKKSSKYILRSQIDSQKETEMVLNRIDFNYHKNFIIFGMKNINLLTEIYNRKTPFSTMIIIEFCENPEKEVYINCEKSNLDFLLDRKTVNLTIGTRNELIKQLDTVLGETIKLYNLRNTEIISMPYVKEENPTEMQEIITTIFERLRTFITGYGNSVEDILVGTDNYLNNWRHIFRGLDYCHFEGIYKDKPAIIVGAGPSLDNNIEQLRSAKGKALIMCVDAALDSLLDIGIIPDIVASIERTEVITKFYKRNIIPDSIVYLGPNVIPGSVLEKFNRIIFTGRSGDAIIRDFNKEIGFNNLEIGANVAHILLAFAQYLGCNPIVFVGLDLAYTNGRTHTTQVLDNFDDNFKNVYKNKESIAYVKGQNGELLETFEFFMYAKNWIEMLISKDKDIKFINATEGGANIEGAENRKLSEVVSIYCSKEDVVTIYDKYDVIFKDNKIDKIDVTRKGLAYISTLEKYFNKVARLAKNNYKNLSQNIETGLVPSMEKQRLLIEAELDKNKGGRFILQSIIISFNRDIHSFPMYLNKEEEGKMLKRSKEYYDTLNKVSKKVNESMKIYKRILNSYLNIFNNEEGAN